ncbi:MAG: 5-oxoprolinase subunit PxpA [Bacteroidota bacterium]
MQTTIDLNSDVGERPEALVDGREEELIRNITSANIACGGHAGDTVTISKVIELCKNYGVGIGAHPSYPDRTNFGRIEMNLSPEEIVRCVSEQVGVLVRLVSKAGCRARHVKPHGALYNAAAKNPAIAAAIARGVRNVDNALILLGLAGSTMLDVWRAEGFTVVGEAFADRRYEPDGTLRSRRFPDALITDPEEAAQQALRMVRDGTVTAVDGTRLSLNAQTLCIHSDTHNAVAIARAVRARLLKRGFLIKPL